MFDPTIANPLAAPGAKLPVYRALPIELAVVKSPAVESCQRRLQPVPGELVGNCGNSRDGDAALRGLEQHLAGETLI